MLLTFLLRCFIRYRGRLTLGPDFVVPLLKPLAEAVSKDEEVAPLLVIRLAVIPDETDILGTLSCAGILVPFELSLDSA